MYNLQCNMAQSMSDMNTALSIPAPRIVVVGVTAAARRPPPRTWRAFLEFPDIELDSLHWQPNWVMTELELFRQLVAQENTQVNPVHLFFFNRII